MTALSLTVVFRDFFRILVVLISRVNKYLSNLMVYDLRTKNDIQNIIFEIS